MSRYDRAALAGKWVAQEARKASSGAAIHDDWKARQAQQAGDIDALERQVDALGDKFNAATEGRPTREPGRGVVPVPFTSAAAPIPYERDVLAGCLKALALHRRVAWAHRMNVGGMVNAAGQHVRFGFKGCSDIIGQLVTGEFLAIECKRLGERPTDDQVAFLGRVQRAGGVAFVAWSIDDIARGLAT